MLTKTVSLLLLFGLIFAVVCSSAIAAETEKININTASAEELALLKGIGKVNAQKIIEFRERQGSFQTPEDLMEVPGIGQKTFDRNKDRIIVE
jgi:competence protein ComEA